MMHRVLGCPRTTLVATAATSVHGGRRNGAPVVAYATADDRVVVTCERLRVRQCWREADGVAAIAVAAVSGSICVATRRSSRVNVYNATSDDDDDSAMTWQLTASFSGDENSTFASSISALACSSTARVVCVADALHMHVCVLVPKQVKLTLASSSASVVRFEARVAHSVALAAPLRALAVAPDDKFVAAFADDDRIVKLWFVERGPDEDGDVEERVDVLLLPHPAPLRSVDWRRARRPLFESVERLRGRRNVEHRNFLLTLALDGVARLWLESPLNEVLQFGLTFVIPMAGSPTGCFAAWIDCCVATTDDEAATAMRERYEALRNRGFVFPDHHDDHHNDGDDDSIDEGELVSLQPHLHLFDLQTLGTVVDDTIDARIDAMRDSDWLLLCSSDGFLVLDAVEGADNGRSDVSVTQWVRAALSGVQRPVPAALALNSSPLAFSARLVRKPLLRDGAATDAMRLPYAVSLVLPCGVNGVRAQELLLEERGSLPVMIDTGFQNAHVQSDTVTQVARHSVAPLVATCDARQVRLWRVHSSGDLRAFGTGCLPANTPPVVRVYWHHTLTVLLVVHTDESVSLVTVDVAKITITLLCNTTLRVPEAPVPVEAPPEADNVDDNNDDDLGSFLGRSAAKPVPKKATFDDDGDDDLGSFLARPKPTVTAPTRSLDDNHDNDDDALGAFLTRSKAGAPAPEPTPVVVEPPAPVATSAPAPAPVLASRLAKIGDIGLLGSSLASLYVCGAEVNGKDLLVWRSEGGAAVFRQPMNGAVSALSCGSDERVWVALGSEIECWSVSVGALMTATRCLRSVDGDESGGSIRQVVASPSGDLLLTSSDDGAVVMWRPRIDDASVQMVRTIVASRSSTVRRLASSSVAVSTAKRTVTEVTKRSVSSPLAAAAARAGALPSPVVATWLGDRSLALLRDVSTDSVVGVQSERVVDIFNWCSVAKRRVVRIQPEFRLVERLPATEWTRAVAWVHETGSLLVGSEFGQLDLHPADRLPDNLRKATAPAVELALKAVDRARLSGLLAEQCAAVPVYHPAQLVELVLGGRSATIGALLAHVCGEAKSVVERLGAVAGANECPITVPDVDWFAMLGNDKPDAAASTPAIDATLDLGSFALAKPTVAARAPASRGDFLNTLDDSFGTTTSTIGRTHDSDDDDNDSDDSDDSDSENGDTLALAATIGAGEPVSGDDNFGFGSEQAHSLVEILSQRVLYGLTSGQQLDFLALSSAFVGTARVRRALDDCAIRFATAARFFEATTLRSSRNAQLPASAMAWAVLSEARAPLLEYFFPSANVDWAQCRALGVGLWLRDMSPLRELLERVAATQFAINQKPGDAALFYVALRKRSALAALYQSVGDKRLAEFFSHDFDESERWRSAAVKNAFVLLSQQRFELAAAMFALGGSLRDMVRVLVDKLHDFQLALVACRLLEPPGGSVLPAILRDVVLPLARQTSNPALALMAHWLLGEREQAVAALVPKYRRGGAGASDDSAPAPTVSFSLMRTYQRNVQERAELITSSQSVSSSESTDESRTLTLPETLVFASEALGSLQFDPSLVHLYQYLAQHPLLRGLVTDDRRMRMLAADAYVECGCLLLAVEQLEHLRGVADVERLRQRCAARLLEEVADELVLRAQLHDAARRDATRSALLARRAIALRVLEGDEAALEKVIVSPQTRLPSAARLVLFEELRAGAPPPSAALLARQSGVLQRALALLTEAAAHLGGGVAPPPSSLAEVLDLFDTLRRIIDRLHVVAVGEEDERRLLASQPLITCVLVTARMTLFWSALDRGDAALHCALMANVSEGELCALLEETLGVAHTRAQARRIALHDAFLDALHDDAHLASQCQSLLCKASDDLFGSAPMLFSAATSGGAARDDAESFDDETRDCLLTSLNVLLMQRAGALLSDVAAGLGETPVAAPAAAAAAAVVGDDATLQSAVLEVTALVSQASRRCIDASWTLVRVLDRPPAAFLAQCEARVAEIARLGIGGRVSQSPFATANAASASTPVLLSLVAYKAPHDLGQHMLAQPTAAAVDLAWRTVATVARFSWRALLWPRAAERVRQRMAASPDRLQLNRGGPAIDITPARLAPAAAVVASRATMTASAGGSYPNGASPIDLFDVRALAASLTLRALQRGLGVWRCDSDAAVVHDAKDLVLSLCVNECDSQYIAIATATGVYDVYVHEENLFSRRAGAPAPGGDLRASTLSPERRIDNVVVLAMTLASHPTQPFYVSGGADGSVLLWQWNTTRALLTFRKSASTRVMRVRFTPTGSRLAAVDSNGEVLLWCFRTSMAGNAVAEPYLTLRCDARGATDLVFLDNGRLFATAGLSDSAGIDDVDAGDATTPTAALAPGLSASNGDVPEALGTGCVRVWDSLRSGGAAVSCVMQFGAVHNEAASALCVSHRHELLISGGKRGEVATWRLRDGQMRTVIAAHTLNVKTLALDRRETVLVSGSTDGSVRTWSMPTLEPLQTFDLAHEKRTFVRATRGVFRNPVSTYGVMHVTISDDEWLLTCGSDGRVCLRRATFGGGGGDTQLRLK